MRCAGCGCLPLCTVADAKAANVQVYSLPQLIDNSSPFYAASNHSLLFGCPPPLCMTIVHAHLPTLSWHASRHLLRLRQEWFVAPTHLGTIYDEATHISPQSHMLMYVIADLMLVVSSPRMHDKVIAADNHCPGLHHIWIHAL
jgi:hypothetical protein